MVFRKNKLAVIAGCGRFGASLADNLCEAGYDVMTIDKDKRSFAMLSDSYSGYQITADASDLTVLEDAGIGEASLFVGATGEDCTNNLICQIAGRIFHIPHVYMRLTDPKLAKITQGFGIQIIYPFRLSMNEFERLSGIEMEEV